MSIVQLFKPYCVRAFQKFYPCIYVIKHNYILIDIDLCQVSMEGLLTNLLAINPGGQII